MPDEGRSWLGLVETSHSRYPVVTEKIQSELEWVMLRLTVVIGAKVSSRHVHIDVLLDQAYDEIPLDDTVWSIWRFPSHIEFIRSLGVRHKFARDTRSSHTRAEILDMRLCRLAGLNEHFGFDVDGVPGEGLQPCQRYLLLVGSIWPASVLVEVGG